MKLFNEEESLASGASGEPEKSSEGEELNKEENKEEKKEEEPSETAA